MMDHVTRLIDELTAELEVARARLDLAQQLQATFAGSGTGSATEPTDTSRQEMLDCPDCGKGYQTPQGLGRHRSIAHPKHKRGKKAAAKPAARSKPKPRPKAPDTAEEWTPARPIQPSEQPTVKGSEFRCWSCGWTHENLQRLIDHVVSEHRRDLMPAERTPRKIVEEVSSGDPGAAA